MRGCTAMLISIPYGSIKSRKFRQLILLGPISIPYGSIKSKKYPFEV